MRVFLPDASRGQGARRAPASQRAAAHPRRRPVCRPGRRRATRTIGCARASATTRSSWRTPIAFRRSCPTSICYLLGEGTHLELYDKLGAHPMQHRRRRRRRLRGVRAERAARQRGRRFQFLGRPPPRHAGARQRLLGNLRARRARRRQIQIRDHRPRRPAAAAEGRSGGASRPRCGPRPPRSWSTPRSCRGRRGCAARRQRARRADVDLRGASRLVAAQARARRPLADLPRARRAAARLCRRHGLHPCRAACR